ncbi:MAG TPA: T9SS type A sorting domain-containing protein [candidate division Zixibacteria bacterium]|nr:T9SS type A sorting domain-containing protein [candidate division Zixibacteria bacterium]
MRTQNRFWLSAALIVLTLCLAGTTLYAKTAESTVGEPPSEVMDWVFHNKGNIVTTIFNWGLMGKYTDVPRGEWPKGSGNNYLAEIKYWMGATLPSGDTVVANTDEDFMPEPNFASSDNDIRIRLSTDQTRYEYDEFDTVGLGYSRPAYGWRTYNLETNAWEYNEIYNPASAEFFQGGPIALQESQYIMNDARDGSPALGLLITQTVYQWNFDYNQDYLFVVLNIKNVSANDYTDFAFGLYCDFDVGGYYLGENGRLGDLVDFNPDENLAWTYDEDNYDPGWGPSVVAGRMGTKYIETPGGLGMTSFRTGIWDSLPDNDQGRYALINSEQFDESLPPNDQYYIQCTRGINLPAGAVVRVVYALVAGQTDDKLIENARMAQVVYDNYFAGPEPPVQPVLKAVAGDHLVKLYWNNGAENSIDPMTGEQDFVGYKIYRSTNYGATWGELTFNADGSRGPNYIPLAEFRVDESTGLIPHTFIDSSLTNGFEYWYAVTAYDKGIDTIPLDPLESGKGRPGEDSSAVSVMPRTDPAGYWPIQNTIEHRVAEGGVMSEGEIFVEAFNQDVLTGREYKLVFSEDVYQTYWHLLDAFTGDTLLADQTDQTARLDAAEVVDGIQVLVQNGEKEPRDMVQTVFSTPGDTTVLLYQSLGSINDFYGVPCGGDMHFRSTYEIRFTETGSTGYWWWDDVTPVELPFEVWNTTFGYQVIAEIIDLEYDQEWDPQVGDFIVVVNQEYDGSPHPEAYPWQHTWAFRFDPGLAGQTGDVFTIYGAPLNSPDDEFYFAAPSIDEQLAARDLDSIRVVPNPYIAHAEWESRAGERRIEFIHLPDEATIRVYTLAGDLVVTLEHEGSGTAEWNLESFNEQSIAPGIYYYHVESRFGSKIGKFAIIK